MDRKEGQTLFEVTPEISHFAELCEKNNAIDKELYTKYEVKRGLRDLNGKGVLAGLTNMCEEDRERRGSAMCRKSLLSRLQYQRSGAGVSER
mgnify:CR=1 FL=1